MSLTFNFTSGKVTSTQSPEERKSYVFDPASANVPDPVPLNADGMDGYHGAYADAKFANQTNFSFSLNDSYATESAYLTFEFTYNPPEFIHNGSRLDIDLTVYRRPGGLFKKALVLGDYEKPDTHSQVSFELGADLITIIPGAGGDIDPLNRNINFSSDREITDSTDLVFGSAEPTIIKNKSWEFFGAAHGARTHIELITDRYVIDQNLTVCGAPTGATVRSMVVNFSTSIDFKRKITSEPLEFAFDDAEYDCRGELLFEPMANGSVMVVPLDVQKNMLVDLTICSGDTNPALNIEEHNFTFDRDFFGKDCARFEFTCYHGSNSIALIAADLLINGVNFYHGAGLNDLSLQTFQTFYANGYHGALAKVNAFTIFQSIPLDTNAYTGATFEADMLTISIFRDMDYYHGGYADADMTVFKPILMETPAYAGATNEFELLTAPVFQVDTALHGGYANADMTIFPVIYIDMDGRGGETLDAVLTPSVVFYPSAEHGADAVFDLETFESEGIAIVEADHGHEAEFTLSTEASLDMDAETGSTGEFELATTTVVGSTAWNGAYADADLERVPPPLLYANGYVGIDGAFELSVIKALFPRAYGGAAGEVELDARPPAEFEPVAYHGIRGTMSAIVEAPFNAKSYHGATLDEIVLNIAPALRPDYARTGIYATVTLNRAPNFWCLGHYGHNTSASLFVPEGESILARAETGGAMIVDALATQEQLLLVPKPMVHGFALYDGLGASGGINLLYLPESRLDPIFGDNVNRLQPGEDLNVDFVDVGDDPWATAPPSVGTFFEVDLQTNPRIEADAFAGEHYAAEIPQLTEQLEPAAVLRPRGGEHAQMAFEPIEYTRFCKGYILPIGKGVSFEFGAESETYDCFYFAAHNGAVATAELSEDWIPSGQMYNGARSWATLSTIDEWTLIARHGSRFHMASNVVFPTRGYQWGSYAVCTMYDEPYLGDHGAVMTIDKLIVPGPGIEWVTEDDCLPNQYQPITEGGDIDVDALEPQGEYQLITYPDVPVEKLPYMTQLLAQCVAYKQFEDG